MQPLNPTETLTMFQLKSTLVATALTIASIGAFAQAASAPATGNCAGNSRPTVTLTCPTSVVYGEPIVFTADGTMLIGSLQDVTVTKGGAILGGMHLPGPLALLRAQPDGRVQFAHAPRRTEPYVLATEEPRFALVAVDHRVDRGTASHPPSRHGLRPGRRGHPRARHAVLLRHPATQSGWRRDGPG